MKAALLREIPGELVIDDVQIDKPGPREVLVKTVAAGCCHSDLDSPLAIAAMGRPSWLAAIVEDLLLERTSVEDALAGYSR